MSQSQDQLLRLRPGRRVGRGDFEILRVLDDGGQATVYLARPHRRMQQPYWLLQLRLALFGVNHVLVERHQLCVLKFAHLNFKDSLRDERDFLSQVQHDRLLKTFKDRFQSSTRQKLSDEVDCAKIVDHNGNTHEYPFITLAYEPGGSLQNLLRRRNFRPLPAPTAVAIAIQVAEALEYLHTRARICTVHHDVSPSNIVFRRPLSPFRSIAPDIVLIDLAAADRPGAERRNVTDVIGKRLYLPPERLARPPAPASPQVDIYGLGMVLYEMLVGTLPKQSTADLQDTHKQLPGVSSQNPRVSSDLDTLIMQTIDRDRERRQHNVPSMQALRQRLQQLPEAQKSGGIRGYWKLPDLARLVGTLLSIALIWTAFQFVNLSALAPGVEESVVATEATVTPILIVTAAPSFTATSTAIPIPSPSSTPEPTSTRAPTPTSRP